MCWIGSYYLSTLNWTVKWEHAKSENTFKNIKSRGSVLIFFILPPQSWYKTEDTECWCFIEIWNVLHPHKDFFSICVLHQNTKLYLLSFYWRQVQVTGEKVGLSLGREIKRRWVKRIAQKITFYWKILRPFFFF